MTQVLIDKIAGSSMVIIGVIGICICFIVLIKDRRDGGKK